LSDRQFNVSLNGIQVLFDFDILASAGGKFRAMFRDIKKQADATGTLQVQSVSNHLVSLGNSHGEASTCCASRQLQSGNGRGSDYCERTNHIQETNCRQTLITRKQSEGLIRLRFFKALCGAGDKIADRPPWWDQLAEKAHSALELVRREGSRSLALD